MTALFMNDLRLKRGLGEVIRSGWQSEHLVPPLGATDHQVWNWVNRADVGFRLVAGMVWDPRLTVLAACAMIQPAADLCGGDTAALVPATERAVYRVDEAEWIGLGSMLDTERERLCPPDSLSWEKFGWVAVHALVNGVAQMRGGAPPGRVVNDELPAAVDAAFRCLRTKYQQVDLLPLDAAIRVANGVMLMRLRRVITPGCFGAPSRKERWSE